PAGSYARLLSLFERRFDGNKDAADFPFKTRQFHLQNTFSGMKNDIDIGLQMAQALSHRLAHAALHAIALDSFAEYAACGQADARSADFARAVAARRKEVSHRGRKVFPALLVHALIIGVLSETCATHCARRPVRSC